MLYITTAGIAATRPKRGRQQRLGDAGRHHRQIGGVRLRDADEAVHDAPHRAEQADERRGGADGGEDAGAADHLAAGGGLEPLQPRGDAFLHAVGRQASADSRNSASAARTSAATRRRRPAGARSPRPASAPRRAHRWRRAGGGARPAVRSSWRTRSSRSAPRRRPSPTITALTTISAAMNMPQGDRSRGSLRMRCRAAGAWAKASAGRQQQGGERRGQPRAQLMLIADFIVPMKHYISLRGRGSVTNEGRSQSKFADERFGSLSHGANTSRREQPHAGARHQHFVLRVGHAVADVVVEQVVADDADGDLAEVAGARALPASIV